MNEESEGTEIYDDVATTHTTTTTTNVINGADKMRFTSLTYEIIEELKMRRKMDVENEQKIERLLQDKFTQGWKLEEERRKAVSTAEKNEVKLRDRDRQLEEMVRDCQIQTAQHDMYRKLAEEEKDTLQEEMRKLQLCVYTLEKRLRESEHQDKLQTADREQHIQQISSLHTQCKQLHDHTTHLHNKQQLLDNKLKIVEDVNRCWQYDKSHQSCVITLKDAESNTLRQQLLSKNIKDKVESESVERGTSEEGNVSTLQQAVQQYEHTVGQLTGQIDEWKHKYWECVRQVDESHRLIHVHLHTAASYKDECDSIHQERDTLAAQLQAVTVDGDNITLQLQESKQELVNQTQECHTKEKELTTEVASLQEILESERSQMTHTVDMLLQAETNTATLSAKLNHLQAVVGTERMSIETQTTMSLLHMADKSLQCLPDTHVVAVQVTPDTHLKHTGLQVSPDTQNKQQQVTLCCEMSQTDVNLPVNTGPKVHPDLSHASQHDNTPSKLTSNHNTEIIAANVNNGYDLLREVNNLNQCIKTLPTSQCDQVRSDNQNVKIAKEPCNQTANMVLTDSPHQISMPIDENNSEQRPDIAFKSTITDTNTTCTSVAEIVDCTEEPDVDMATASDIAVHMDPCNKTVLRKSEILSQEMMETDSEQNSYYNNEIKLNKPGEDILFKEPFKIPPEYSVNEQLQCIEDRSAADKIPPEYGSVKESQNYFIGVVTQTSGDVTRASGDVTETRGDATQIGGDVTQAGGDPIRTEGDMTQDGGDVTQARGDAIQAGGDVTQAGGDATQSRGDAIQARGDVTQAGCDATQSRGDAIQAGGDVTQYVGDATQARGEAIQAKGDVTQDVGDAPQAGGDSIQAGGDVTQDVGDATQARGDATQAGGDVTQARGDVTHDKSDVTHPRGEVTQARGDATQVRGDVTQAGSVATQTRGDATQAGGDVTQDRGDMTQVGGDVIQAGGDVTQARGDVIQTGGDATQAGGDVKQARGDGTQTGGDAMQTGGDVTQAGGDLTQTGHHVIQRQTGGDANLQKVAGGDVIQKVAGGDVIQKYRDMIARIKPPNATQVFGRNTGDKQENKGLTGAERKRRNIPWDERVKTKHYIVDDQQ